MEKKRKMIIKRLDTLFICGIVLLFALPMSFIYGLMQQQEPKIIPVDRTLKNKLTQGVKENFSFIASIKVQYFASNLEVRISLNKDVEDKEYYRIFKLVKQNILAASTAIKSSGLYIKIEYSNTRAVTFTYDDFSNTKRDKLIKWQVDEEKYTGNSWKDKYKEYFDD